MNSSSGSARGRARGELDLGVEGQQGGTPSAAGEALQMLPAEGAGVLDLHAADLARGELEPVEAGRQVGARSRSRS